MIHHSVRIPIGWKNPVSLFFFGDLQYTIKGAKGFDQSAWDCFKDEFRATPHAYAIGLGDYGDFLRPTQQSKMYQALSADDSARRQQDDLVRSNHDKIIEVLGFLEGKVIGLHEGHHEWKFASGENTTQRLCSALKTTYLGWMASTRVVLEVTGSRATSRSTCSRSYTIISLHGTGNSRFVSTDARWLESNLVPAWGADHYVRGHGCKCDAWEPFEFNEVRRSGPAGVKKMIRRCLMVGGFHDGYTNGWESSYVERAGFLPQPRAWGVIRLKITSSKKALEEIGCGSNSICLDVEHLTRTPPSKSYE